MKITEIVGVPIGKTFRKAFNTGVFRQNKYYGKLCGEAGSLTVKVVPSPTLESTWISPLCFLTIS